MSGAEIVGVVLGLWPIVITLAETYKNMKGTGSGALSSQVLIARTVYDQTMRALLSSVVSDQELGQLLDLLPASRAGQGQPTWATEELRAKLSAKIGEEKLSVVFDRLGDMESCLDKVKRELENMCKSGEDSLLGKLGSRARAMKASLPGIGVMSTVKRIHILNKDIRLLLDDRPPFNITFRQNRQPTGASPLFDFGDEASDEEAASFFNAVQSFSLNCGCEKPHVISVGCHCAACSKPLAPAPTSAHKWEFGLLIPHGTGSSAGVPHVLLLEPPGVEEPTSVSKSADVENLCSFLEEAATMPLGRPDVREITNGNKTYKMRVSKVDTGPGKTKLAHDTQPETQRQTQLEAEHAEGDNSIPINAAPESSTDNSNTPTTTNAATTEAVPGKNFSGGAVPPLVPPSPRTPPPAATAPPQSPEAGKGSNMANSAADEKAAATGTPDKPNGVRSFNNLKDRNSGLVVKHRRELALRLSSALMRLRNTPWVDGSWTWNDVWVTVTQSHGATNGDIRDLSILFIPRDFYSNVQASDGASVVTAVNPDPMREIIGDEPVLTRLGFALIELALGKHIEDMWADYEVPDVPSDKELNNMLAAKRLLKTTRIGDEAGKQYEGVVQACIHQTYYDLQTGRNIRLLLKHDSFPQLAQEAIISPLFDVYKGFAGEVTSAA